MIRNYLKITWRNMMTNKFFSFVNTFGLSIGLACCMFIAVYVHYETSYDSYQKNIDRLYEVGTVLKNKGEKEASQPFTSPPIAAALKQQFPEVEETARLLPLNNDDKNLVQDIAPGGKNRSFLEQDGYIAAPSFFTLFTYDFIEGSPANALTKPNTIVISEG